MNFQAPGNSKLSEIADKQGRSWLISCKQPRKTETAICNVPMSSIENKANKTYELLKLVSAHNGHVGTWYNYHFFKKRYKYVVYF
jgi:invasion protein IalB